MSVTWLGSPRSMEGGKVKLTHRLDTIFSEDDGVFKKAEPMTVRLRGTMVLEKEENWIRGENDLIIVTTFKFGKEALVERLHFMKDDQKLGWQGEFFHEVIMSTRDFKEEPLTLRVQVYDTDGGAGDVAEEIAKLAETSAIVFPALAPYAAGISSIGRSLIALINQLDDHDKIIDKRLRLRVSEPEKGHVLLQPGYYVCFRNEVNEDLYLTSPNLRVERENGEEFKDCSYAVLEIERVFQEENFKEIEQKAAKLISELDGKGQSGKPTLEFLIETLNGYDKFKKLERIKGLEGQDKLSDAEKVLLGELKAIPELQDFLPH